MDNLTKYLKEITKASNYGNLVFFVGSGLSKLSNYPTWSELVDEFYIELHKEKKTTDYTSNDLLQIPQIYFDVQGENSYDSIINKVFNVDTEPNSIHYKILALNPMHIITTNYDDLIEKTCCQRGKYYSHISAEEDVANVSSTRYLLKAHGDFTRGYNGKYIILKESDYYNYDIEYPLIGNLMKTIIATNTIVFIGYGLGDYNINLLLNWVKNKQDVGYNKPFFIRTEAEPIKDYINRYYEKKGLRIIDSTSLVKTDKDDYLTRYSAVMDKIIGYNNYNNLVTDDEVINYLFMKLEPLFELKYIRKLDLNLIFDNKYYFEVNGNISTLKDNDNDYLKHFFEIKDNSERLLSNKVDEKFEAILQFFNKNNIFCINYSTGQKGAKYTFSIENLAFNNFYDEIEKKVNSIVSNTLEKNYEVAFYLANLGYLEKSYNLYSDIIKKSLIESNFLIYYLSQINRFHLYILINGYHKYGRINAFYNSKYFIDSFTENFFERITNEMNKFDLNEIFRSMPNEFQENYKILEVLSNKQFLYEDTVKLFELSNKIHSEIKKGTISFGNLTAEKEIQYRFDDNLRFLYENCLLISTFYTTKNYIKNSIILQFEKEQHNQTRDLNEFMEMGDTIFSIGYYDFVSITKSLSLDDVRNLERSCNIQNFKFIDENKIEEYICRMADFLINHYGGDRKVSYFFHEKFINEAKIAFYFAKYIKLSTQALEKIIMAILFNFTFSNDNLQRKYIWCARLCESNGLPINAISIIEKFLIKIYDEVKKNEHVNLTLQEEENVYNLSHLIHYYHEGFISEILSGFVLKLNDKAINQINFAYKVFCILSNDAKNYLSVFNKISGIEELLYRHEIGKIDNLSPYEDVIMNYLKEQLLPINNNKNQQIFLNGHNYVVSIAILYFCGKIRNLDLKSLLGVDNQYDFFVDPDHFDYENFKPEWLKSYKSSLMVIILENENIKFNIMQKLKSKIENKKNDKYVDILVKYFI